MESRLPSGATVVEWAIGVRIPKKATPINTRRLGHIFEP